MLLRAAELAPVRFDCRGQLSTVDRGHALALEVAGGYPTITRARPRSMSDRITGIAATGAAHRWWAGGATPTRPSPLIRDRADEVGLSIV